jgi:peptide deformylase
MAVRPILRLGHPCLRQVASPVTEFSTPALRELVQDLEDTMRANSGAGLAAIQIGVPVRVVVFELEHNPR